MTRGTYERTPEIRERNRQSATPSEPCDPGCGCGRHRSYGGGRPCPQGCTCRKHQRSTQHNAKISASMKAKGKR